LVFWPIPGCGRDSLIWLLNQILEGHMVTRAKALRSIDIIPGD
jgi:hypothetical protein